MLFLRPSREDDLDGLMRLAGMTGAGFTSLSPDRHLLRRRLRHSAYSFADALESRDDAHYLFALEDSDSGRLAGVCGILAATGRDNPFYSYRVGLVVNASRRLNISNAVQTLYLCNDYTGCAEIGSLFLDPDYRGRSAGRLLSRSRFLFLAEFRQRFPERVIAEMRGVSDDAGYSPFWENLGRHFLAMEFTQADYLAGGEDNSFIAELMPHHPIYVPMLSPEARAVIAQVHRDTVAARRILESEGFRYQNYVDIFDAGPTLEAHINDIQTVQDSRRLSVRIADSGAAARPCVLATTRHADFRCMLAPAVIDQANATATIGAAEAELLQVTAGAAVRVCAA
ncbi:MAG TPA: arginine N-succinyltransferase [Salinisphaeraceae bacterium]|nr:arginine N-succinyltransferase [Salinisphaeraceae bacterium]